MNSPERDLDLKPDKLCYTIDESARALGVHRRTVYRQIAIGELIAINLFGRTVVTTESMRQAVATAPRKVRS